MRLETNTARVTRIRQALDIYRLGGMTSNAVVDLLADLMHICDTQSHRPGWYFANLLATAEDHYQAERTKE